MNLYEINDSIMNCIDEETGEIIDIEALESLEMEREKKIENLALWYKNLLSDAEALKAEKEAFQKREKSAKSKAESIKKYLSSVLSGEQFQTSKCSLSFRKSETVEILDIDAFMNDKKSEDYLKYAEPTVDKAKLKKALKNGEAISGVCINENLNIQIK